VCCCCTKPISVPKADVTTGNGLGVYWACKGGKDEDGNYKNIQIIDAPPVICVPPDDCTGNQQPEWNYYAMTLEIPKAPCEREGPRGACCDSNGNCHYVTESWCEDEIGGEWQGEGVQCFPDPCEGGPSTITADGPTVMVMGQDLGGEHNWPGGELCRTRIRLVSVDDPTASQYYMPASEQRKECRQTVSWDCWDGGPDECGWVGQYRCGMAEGTGPAWLIDGYPEDYDHRFTFEFKVTSPFCDCVNMMCDYDAPGVSCPHDCPNFTFGFYGGCGPWPPADDYEPGGPSSGATRICYPDNPCLYYPTTDDWSIKPGDPPLVYNGGCASVGDEAANNPQPECPRSDNCWPNGWLAIMDDCQPFDTWFGPIPYYLTKEDRDNDEPLRQVPPHEDHPYSAPDCPGTFGAMNSIIDGYMNTLFFGMSSTDNASSTVSLSEIDAKEEIKCEWQCIEEDDVTYFELLNSACDCGSDYISGPCTPGEIIRTDCA